MSALQLLAGQLNELYQRASAIDAKRQPGKPQDWFESGLFSCHSPDLADYVADAMRNLKRLSDNQSTLSPASQQRLAELSATSKPAVNFNAVLNYLSSRALGNLPSRQQSPAAR